MTYEFPRGDQKLFNDALTKVVWKIVRKVSVGKYDKKKYTKFFFPTFPTKIFHKFCPRYFVLYVLQSKALGHLSGIQKSKV